jgi:hypothetical protein
VTYLEGTEKIGWEKGRSVLRTPNSGKSLCNEREKEVVPVNIAKADSEIAEIAG